MLNVICIVFIAKLLFCKQDWHIFVKLRQGSGKEGQGMALKAKGLKA